MGTRSVILAFDGQRVVRFYKHSNGYPTEVLSELIPILKKQPIMEELIGDFLCENFAEIDKWDNNDPAEYESTAVKLEHWGCQSDLEWLYYIDLRDNSLNVYSAGYGLPEVHLKNGPTNPESYAEHLHEKYQEKTRKEIRQSMKNLQKVGWAINAPNSIKYLIRLAKRENEKNKER